MNKFRRLDLAPERLRDVPCALESLLHVFTHTRQWSPNLYYEMDDTTVSTVLRLDEYGGNDNHSWVLLHEDEAAA